jgi:hypothetical protein
MEVHHTQHPTHKKKWSEYIIEFFMLFTAVTLGFFAENIREHLADENKAKELLHVVAKDLRSDLDQMKMLKQMEAEKIILADSLKTILNSNPKNVDQSDYYRIIMNFASFYVLNPNDKSIIDAESKGYFFKKENKDLAYLIKQYNFYLKDYMQSDKLFSEQANRFVNVIIPQITDPEIIDMIWRLPSPPLKNKLGIKPIKEDAKIQAKFFLSISKGFMDGYMSDIDSMTLYANKAINLIDNSK